MVSINGDDVVLVVFTSDTISRGWLMVVNVFGIFEEKRVDIPEGVREST